jgi:tetratricopeptide (TPR) repeat protein
MQDQSVTTPLTIAAMFSNAVQAHQASRLAEAEVLYRQVLAADDRHADSLHLLGLIGHCTGRLDMAAEMIGQAIEIYPQAAAYHFSMGNVLKEQGQSDRAIGCYRKCVALRPDHPDAHNSLGIVLCEQGRLAEAEGCYARALALRRSPELLGNLGVLRRELGDLAGAERLLREALSLRPGFGNALYNLGVTLIDAQRPDEAIAFLAQWAEDPRAPAIVHANLARAFHETGDRVQALRHGRRALLQKDEEARRDFVARGGRALAGAAVRPFDPTRPQQNIVAFSLWGAKRLYVEGAIANAHLVRMLYPGWTCRVYLDDSVPREACEALDDAGAEVVTMPQTGTHYGLFWRFFAADDPKVAYFLCRDAASRINVQEVAAVNEWLGSGRPFHVMRDAPFHTELMLAGLWGGVGGCLPDLRGRIDRFYRSAAHRWIDQDFLRCEIWPGIAEQTLVHDSCYDLFGARPYPAEARLPPGEHVGACYSVSDTA